MTSPDLVVHVYGNVPDELADAITTAGATLTSDLASANFLVWNSFGTELTDVVHPGLRWVQLPSAGVDHWLGPEGIDSKRVWLSASGAYSEAVANHALACLLAAIHRIPEHGASTTWERRQFRPITERRIAVLGFGGIGREIGRRLQTLGAREVIGVVRNQREEEHADRMAELTDSSWCEGIDDIVNVLPSTPATVGIISAEVLAKLPADGCLINVGRGDAIDDDAVLAALAEDRLGGVVLDVTEPEPLADDHPYWRDPRVVITSHSANPSHTAEASFIEHVGENVRRVVAGEELLGVVDLDRGY